MSMNANFVKILSAGIVLKFLQQFCTKPFGTHALGGYECMYP